jgi:hypothetical protein
MTNAIEEFDEITDLVLKRLQLFACHGYGFAHSEILKSKAELKYLSFEFHNESTQMRIVLSYVQPKDGTQRLFSIFITNSRKEEFHPTSWLKQQGRIEDVKHLMRSSESVSVIQFAENALRFIHDLFKNELKDIVEGRSWDDAPIDWVGFK